MVHFIPGTMVIKPYSDSEVEEEEKEEAEHDEVEYLLLEQNDGWSHCFYCDDKHAKPVQDIIHNAMYIHFFQWERTESTFTL